jgi:serine O-acetyltransferase
MSPSFTETLSLIREDLAAHRGDWTLPGFQALAVHRFGHWSQGVTRRPARAPLTALYRSMFAFVRNVYGIELPDTAELGRGIIIEHQGGIVVHGRAKVGDGSRLRQGVTLGNRRADDPLSAPTIGANVNIGAGAQILGGIRVGDNATIGANAVVLTDVPPGDTVVGIPARSVKRPPDDTPSDSTARPVLG